MRSIVSFLPLFSKRCPVMAVRESQLHGIPGEAVKKSFQHFAPLSSLTYNILLYLPLLPTNTENLKISEFYLKYDVELYTARLFGFETLGAPFKDSSGLNSSI